ncbi:MAG: IclR family transcriptional regulator [Solirubrobacterales bacterium]|nr:IclR family transcriptional regulator [Solirubrobacterales bacterium]MBV9715902.1 IclR family transcriptional regulator [Solirubrobacterales bacterium]
MPIEHTKPRKTESGRSNGNAPVAVLSKAVCLLDHIAEQGEVTPARLAELAGEPRSTVYRLLASLQELELVEPGPRRGTYVLGVKLFRLGRAVVSRFDERQAALPVMQRIHDEIGETTFLLIRRGYEAVCIERIDGTRVNLLALGLGGSLPLHAGSAPRAMLAFMAPSEWDDYLDHVPLEAYTSKSIITREQLIAELEATRERSYAISDEDVTPGVASVGAPIFDHDGAIRASLSVGGMREPILGDGSRAIELLLEGAAEISRALGHDMRAS